LGKTLIVCLHDQNKSGFFGGRAFNQSNFKSTQKALIGWK